jgi:hypothetical protein
MTLMTVDEAFKHAQVKANAIYDDLDQCVIKALGERPTRIDGIASWVAATTLAGYLEGWLLYHKAMGITRLGLHDLNTVYATGLNHGFRDAMNDSEPSEPDTPEYDPGPEIDDEGGMSEYRHQDPPDNEEGGGLK